MSSPSSSMLQYIHQMSSGMNDIWQIRNFDVMNVFWTKSYYSHTKIIWFWLKQFVSPYYFPHFWIIHVHFPYSLPRCYPDQQRISTKSTPNSPYTRSLTMDPKSNLSPKYKMSQRPKLKRETAQDIEDEDDHKMVHLSPNSLLKPIKQKQLIYQKSAPGNRTL